jgi:hypothetical protein
LEELFFVFFLFFVHFEFEMFAAVGAIHFAFVNDAAVDADNFAASGAFYFVEVFVVAAAVAIVVIAAAITIAIVVIAAAIVIFIIIVLKGFKVFVDEFNLFANFCKSVLNVFYIICKIFKDVSDCGKNFVVAVKAFHKTFEMSNFFSNSHDNFSFAVKNFLKLFRYLVLICLKAKL